MFGGKSLRLGLGGLPGGPRETGVTAVHTTKWGGMNAGHLVCAQTLVT